MNEPHAAPAATHYAPAPPPQAAPAAAGRDPRLKSPLLAGILSAMPGLGQVYVGYYQRGFIHAIVVASLITLLGVSEEFSPIIPFAALFMAFFWLYNIIDASRRAVYVNQIVAGGDPLDVPEDFKSAGLRGSVAGGSALILFGAIALGNTVFGISLDWIEDWWPMAPIGFGVFLVYKAMGDRNKDAA